MVCEIQHLTTGYRAARRTHPVGHALDATLRGGTLTALLGTNGSGKSTLLRTMAGLQPPLSGTVLWDGRRVETLDLRTLARTVSVVLTARPDAAMMTVREVVATGRIPHAALFARLGQADRARVERAIALVGATPYADRSIARLSDGERQRAFIAKALAQDTDAILLDEPTAFLDYPSKVGTLQLLRRLAHDEGKAILLSTHDVELALRHADRLWLLSPDRIEDGTPADFTASGRLRAFFGQGNTPWGQGDEGTAQF